MGSVLKTGIFDFSFCLLLLSFYTVLLTYLRPSDFEATRVERRFCTKMDVDFGM